MILYIAYVKIDLKVSWSMLRDIWGKSVYWEGCFGEGGLLFLLKVGTQSDTKSGCAVLYSSVALVYKSSDTGVSLTVLSIGHPLNSPSTLNFETELVCILVVCMWLFWWFGLFDLGFGFVEFTIHSQLWNWVGLCFDDLCVALLVTWLFVSVLVTGLI